MKSIMITLAMATVLFAQSSFKQNGFQQERDSFSRLYLVGGISLANIVYNDADIQDQFDPDMYRGAYVGLESPSGPALVGLGFLQQGARIKDGGFKGTDRYNYLSGYLLIPYHLTRRLALLAGLQGGYCLFGDTERDGESEHLTSNDFDIDYGLLLGANLSARGKLGLRGTWYYGLADVLSDNEADLSFRNRGFTLSLVYRL